MMAVAIRLNSNTLGVEGNRALVHGFDHFKACNIGMYVLFTLPFLVPFGWFAIGLLATLVWGAVSLILAFVLVRFCRFTLVVEGSTLELSRSWLGLEYFRASAPLDKVRVSVAGTGDWGDEGDWPMQRYCEVVLEDGANRAERVGTPATAVAIKDFIEARRAQ